MLQDEIWLGRIGGYTGLQLTTVAQLWAGLMSLLEANLTNGRAIDLGRLGILSLELDKEYLARTLGGEIYLVPPHLTLRLGGGALATNGIVWLEDLADSLSEETKLPLSTVQPFLRAIIPLSEESLSGGNPIVWGGIGSWTTDASEGILVYRLSVSRDFRDTLNKPFGMFAPILVSDELISRESLPIIEIDSIDDLEGELLLEHRLVEASEEEVSTESSDQEIEASEEERAPKGEETVAISSDNFEGDDLNPLKDTDQEEIKSEDDGEEAEALLVEVEDRRQKHRIYWIILSVLLILCLSLLWFLSRDVSTEKVQRELVPPTEEPENKEIAKVEVDSVASSTIRRDEEDKEYTSPSDQESIAQKKQDLPSDRRTDSVAQAKRRIERPADRLEVVVLGDGESLQTLARRKYGDPVFWVYIYEENREFISNPDEIPSGIQLRLPPAKQYQINANDTKSRQRALVLQKSYQTYREFGN